MRYFTFANPQTVDFFEWLMQAHPDSVAGMLSHAKSHAGEARTDPELAHQYDILHSDHEQVWWRLGDLLEQFAWRQCEQLHGIDESSEEGDDPFQRLLFDAMQGVDFKGIGKAVYYGVEPGDPFEEPLPEIF